MSSRKVTVLVCRSCIRENPQSEPALANEESLRITYKRKLKRGFFRNLAELQIVDCLTNCQNPNSVQIDCEDGEMLFGRISTCQKVDEIVVLVNKLRDLSEPLKTSEILAENLIFVRSHRDWRSDGNIIHADRIRLSEK